MITPEELSEAVKACNKCPLRESATAPVPDLLIPNSKYLLIGEAPGREEDKLGTPFIGLAGKRLNKLIELAGIDINDCSFANVVKCRPPSNRDPKKAEIRSCLPWLKEAIKIVKPCYLITLGRVPLNLFSPYGIRMMHGTMFEAEIEIEGEKTNVS